MSRQDQFEHVLASLHETVLDDSRWPATSALIDQACGAKGNFLVTGDGAVRDDIQLDRRSRIVAANDRARAYLRKGDGLSDKRGVLRAASPGDDVALQEMLARALLPFGGWGTSGSMTVKRPGAAPRLVVHVTPVGEGSTELGTMRSAALVLVVDPVDRGRIDPDLVAATLGLTSAQSRVAVLLAQGHTLHEIAAETGCKQSTIRWHLKQINIKLHLSRQLELVQLVRSLVDISEGRR